MQLTVQSCCLIGWEQSFDVPSLHTGCQTKSDDLPVNYLSMHTNCHTSCGTSRLNQLSEEHCIFCFKIPYFLRGSFVRRKKVSPQFCLRKRNKKKNPRNSKKAVCKQFFDRRLLRLAFNLTS